MVSVYVSFALFLVVSAMYFIPEKARIQTLTKYEVTIIGRGKGGGVLAPNGQMADTK